MMNTYNESYLNDASECLGEALEYVSSACGVDPSSFLDMFIVSGYADRFADGEMRLVSGMTGTELAMEILKSVGLEFAYPDSIVDYSGFAKEYYLGKCIAEFQWRTGRSFKQILDNISLDDFSNIVDNIIEHDGDEGWKERAFSNLSARFVEPVHIQAARKEYGYSQRQLAEASGINIRTLQQYEIKSKDINRAAVASVMAMAGELGVCIEDILEHEAQ